jgi:hypothetical protein
VPEGSHEIFLEIRAGSDSGRRFTVAVGLAIVYFLENAGGSSGKR